jgi:hypothetical protein
LLLVWLQMCAKALKTRRQRGLVIARLHRRRILRQFLWHMRAWSRLRRKKRLVVSLLRSSLLRRATNAWMAWTARHRGHGGCTPLHARCRQSTGVTWCVNARCCVYLQRCDGGAPASTTSPRCKLRPSPRGSAACIVEPGCWYGTV